MAAKKNEDLKTIEEWKEETGTPDAVFEGTKAAQGWQSLKAVPKEEYEAAVESFKKAPVCGRRAK